MTNDANLIAESLVRYRAAKREAEEQRKFLLRFMVERCGISQAEAIKMSVTDFCDGFLVAMGHNPAHREANP